MRKIDITEKLDFESKQCLVIKGKEIFVNSDAPTVLKVMALMSGENSGTPESILKMYEMLFTERGREELSKVGLSFADLVVVVKEATALITGGDQNTER